MARVRPDLRPDDLFVDIGAIGVLRLDSGSLGNFGHAPCHGDMAQSRRQFPGLAVFEHDALLIAGCGAIRRFPSMRHGTAGAVQAAFPRGAWDEDSNAVRIQESAGGILSRSRALRRSTSACAASFSFTAASGRGESPLLQKHHLVTSMTWRSPTANADRVFLKRSVRVGCRSDFSPTRYPRSHQAPLSG